MTGDRRRVADDGLHANFLALFSRRLSEAARKTSSAERFGLLCRMELDLVSNLSIKPELRRIERYEATPSCAIQQAHSMGK